MRPGVPGEGGTGTGANEEQQGPTASERKRALPEALMEEVIEPKNLNRAYQRVKANKGAPGVDGMNVDDLGGWLAEHWEELVASLLEGSYQPQPVRGVEIPKPGGGVRQLGIPTVVDRLVQQGIFRCWTRCWTQPFRSQATVSVPGETRTRRCARRRST